MQRRTVSLIGEERYNRLVNSRVAVVGVGGVGGYVVEMLARVGIGSITLIDGDKVDISNINRQIIALSSTVGRYKVEVAKERVLMINPNCDVIEIPKRISKDNIDNILNNEYDYIVDAIDSVDDKVALIKFAKTKGYNIISSMGAGNRYKESAFTITDIYKTKYDRLARKMRGILRKEGIESLEVCYSETPSEAVDGIIGSISYVPAICGITIASHVIRQLMEKE